MKKILFLISIFLILCSEKNEDITEKNIIRKPMNLIVTAKGGLRFREKPSIKGKVILTIPEGESIEAYNYVSDTETHDGKEGKWQRVKYKGKFGYVFSGFLEYQSTKLKFLDNNLSEIEGKLNKILGFDILSQINLIEKNRLPILNSKAFESYRVFEDGAYKIYVFSPNPMGCNDFGSSSCVTFIFKNNILFSSDLNIESYGDIIKQDEGVFEFLVEAGCGTGCDFDYKATRHILNTKNNSFTKENISIWETYCVKEADNDVYLEDCNKCSEIFNGV